NWLNHLRIAEGDVAPFQPIFGSVEGDVALCNVHSPQHRRIRRRTPDAQVDVAGDFSQRSLHSQLRCRSNMDIESQIVQKRIVRAGPHRMLGTCQILGKIEVRIYGKPKDRYISGKQRALRRSRVAQTGIRGSAEARRITQPYIVPISGHIEVEAIPEGNKSAQIQISASGMRSQAFNLHAVLSKNQVAVDLAQPIWQVDS